MKGSKLEGHCEDFLWQVRILSSFMKTTYDISLYYQILPHSQMLTIRKKSVAVRKVKSVDYQLPAQP